MVKNIEIDIYYNYIILFLMQIDNNEDIFNTICNFISFNDILRLRLVSKKLLTFTKNNKIHNTIKYYYEFLDNRNTEHDKYRYFIKLVNNITIKYSSLYYSDEKINKYKLCKWDKLFSNIILTPAHYAIYYAYFIMNKTATSEKINLNSTSYIWRAITYDNGMIKQLTNTTGHLYYNNNITNTLEIELIFNRDKTEYGWRNGNIIDVNIYYSDNIFYNKLSYKKFIPIVDDNMLKLVLNSNRLSSPNKIRYIEKPILFHNCSH